MKAKTIKKVLRAKVDSWLATIEDERVRGLAEKNTIVTGGAIASMLLKEPVNDFDIYFRTREATLEVAKYYVERFESKRKSGIPCAISVVELDGRIKIVVKSSGIASEEGTGTPYQYFESQPEEKAGDYVSSVMTDPGEIEDRYVETEAAALENDAPDYRPVFVSTNAITLSNRVQIIIRFYGEPDAIHENYDFSHCTNYWTSWDNRLELRPAALECLLSRELRYVGSKYPLCSIIRLRKFIARGWSVNAGQILKMVMQLQELDLLNPEVLADQLTGVDSAYFAEIIAKLKEKDPQKVNTAYLVEIIDRMF